MKKASILWIILLLLCAKSAFAWRSEGGTGVVSANSTVVLTSIEATQVLRSDLYSRLLGETDLGGVTNYASFDSGGLFSLRNVASSQDVIRLNRNQFAAWTDSRGNQVLAGVSNDNVYTIGVPWRQDSQVKIVGTVSANDATVSKLTITSVNVAGTIPKTSTYTTGTCSFTFSSGILTNASC